MHPTQADLDQVQTDLRSAHQPTRYAAAHRMRTWIRLNPACHPAALEIFGQILANPLDGGTVNAALFGLEELGNKTEAQTARLNLIKSPNPDLVRTALLGFRDPLYAPLLVDLLTDRTETEVRISLIRALGRMPSASKLALPFIVKFLSHRDLRPHIADALGDLGDPAAIPYLEQLLNDSTEAWEIDNHGPVLRVRDLAAESIRKINQGTL